MRRLGLLAILALAVAGAGAAWAHDASTGFYGCAAFTSKHPKPQVRPASIVVTCADANFSFAQIHWVTWGATSAQGMATAHVNLCQPNCSAGMVVAAPAAVTLGSPKACRGARVFTHLAWRFTSSTPRGELRRDSMDYPC
jgi:hypothetical protein